MDRMDSAVDYLNAHSTQPETEEDFVCFMVFAAILRDGIRIVHNKVTGAYPNIEDGKKWFSGALRYNHPVFNEDTCPTDEDFFEYLRAIVFAHPFGTDRRQERPFMAEGEKHVSPWVFCNGHFLNEGCVGVRVYTNLQNETKDTFIPFANLKGFVAERYSFIDGITSWAKKCISEQNERWRKREVNRQGDPTETLEDIVAIMRERYVEDTWPEDEALDFLSFSFHAGNDLALELIKKRIVEVLPALCDCIDDLDYEGAGECLGFIGERPEGLHGMAHYQLEKTFTYIPDEISPCEYDPNVRRGLEMAREFYESYGNRYVNIDFDLCSGKEIKLLTRAACILGFLDEAANKK